MSDATIDRGDFLKLLGLGGGLAGLGVLAAAPSAQAGSEARHLIVLTHGSDDPDRAVLGLHLAQVILAKNLGTVQIWMTLRGAEVAHKEKSAAIRSTIFASAGSAAEIVADLAAKGVTFHLCPPCATAAGAKGAAKHDVVVEAGGDWLLAQLPGAQVLWF